MKKYVEPFVGEAVQQNGAGKADGVKRLTKTGRSRRRPGIGLGGTTNRWVPFKRGRPAARGERAHREGAGPHRGNKGAAGVPNGCPTGSGPQPTVLGAAGGLLLRTERELLRQKEVVLSDLHANTSAMDDPIIHLPLPSYNARFPISPYRKSFFDLRVRIHSHMTP